jgi:hypothetical protein
LCILGQELVVEIVTVKEDLKSAHFLKSNASG